MNAMKGKLKIISMCNGKASFSALQFEILDFYSIWIKSLMSENFGKWGAKWLNKRGMHTLDDCVG